MRVALYLREQLAVLGGGKGEIVADDIAYIRFGAAAGHEQTGGEAGDEQRAVTENGGNSHGRFSRCGGAQPKGFC